MRLVETSKFKKSRKKIKGDLEKEALREAVLNVLHDTIVGKKLKGKFQDLRPFSYSIKGQNRRLIYKQEKDCLILFSFGPREGIYK